MSFYLFLYEFQIIHFLLTDVAKNISFFIRIQQKMGEAKMTCTNIGYSNFISNGRLLGIVTPDSAPTKRLVQRAKERDLLIDTTFGRKTRSILIMDNGYLFLSSLQPETVVQRLKAPEDTLESHF